MNFLLCDVFFSESNTRLVRWRDGSMQLLVGDDPFECGVSELNDR